MSMSDTAWARRLHCEVCPHLRIDTNEMLRRGTRWGTFCAFGAGGPETWRELSPAVWEGHRGGCAAGTWTADGAPEPVPADAGCADCGGSGRRLRLSAVLTARNEGDQVAATIRSFAASVRDVDLEIVLVDDGSSDGSCAPDALPRDLGCTLVVVRQEGQQGVGKSRNAGWRRATGDVVSFHDAHMRAPEGALDALALRAARADAFVCSSSGGINSSRPRLWGADLFWNVSPHGPLQPQYRLRRPEQEWEPVPCPMGAGYVVARRVAERLEAATGQLWDDTAGVWGFSEQAMAVKCWLMQLPVVVSRDWHLGHKYRDANPARGANDGLWRNACRCTRLLFGEGEWRRRFEPWLVQRLGPERVAEIVDDVPEISAAHCARVPGQVIRGLCGWRAIIGPPDTSEAHADHAWLDGVREACLDLGSRHPGGGARVLIWRPGECLATVRAVLPHADVHAIVANGPRAACWMPLAKAWGISCTSIRLGKDYAERPRQWGRRFDLVLVNGEMQAACTATARAVLADGGLIVRNPRADRCLLASEGRKIEAKLREEAGLGPDGEPVPSPDGEPVLTVSLLNWERPQNVGRVLECLEEQARHLPLRVVVWDNAGGDKGDLVVQVHGEVLAVREHPLVDLVVRSQQNVGCFARWWLASRARTEFVCSMDDDLIFKDERVLADAVAACRDECPDGIVGLWGWSPRGDRDYRHGRHHNGTTTGTRCQIIKGRLMLFRRELLERVPLEIPEAAGIEGLSHREDDVWLSLCIGRGAEEAHCIPARLGKRWTELPQHGSSASSEPGHYARRDAYRHAILDWLARTGAADPRPIPV